MRIPTHEPRAASDIATCEHVFERIAKLGPVIDEPTLRHAAFDDPALIRYNRDTLNMFAQLGQVDHVRRDLWVLPPDDAADLELVRLRAASHACGEWVVAAGTWALELRGVLPSSSSEGASVAFVLTPKRGRPTTYRDASRVEQSTLPSGPNAARHVTLVLGRSIAAVTRPCERVGAASWVGRDTLGEQTLGGQELGGHVLEVPDAFISLLEHPRLSGGFITARRAALPVLARVGIAPLIELGRRHPVRAVRSRLAFVLMEAVMRTEHCMTWFGLDEWGRPADSYQRWWIPRALGVNGGVTKTPTLLDPHRRRVGRYDPHLHLLDNRDAPIAERRRPTSQ